MDAEAATVVFAAVGVGRYTGGSPLRCDSKSG